MDKGGLDNNFLQLLHYKIAHGVEEPVRAYEEYLRRLAYDVEKLPGARFQHSSVADGAVDVNGPIGDDHFNVFFQPISRSRKEPYLRFTYFYLKPFRRRGGAPGNGLIQLVAKENGALTMEYPHVKQITKTLRGGDVPYPSAKYLLIDAEKKFPIILKGKIGPETPA
jgi:hypothetical protein